MSLVHTKDLFSNQSTTSLFNFMTKMVNVFVFCFLLFHPSGHLEHGYVTNGRHFESCTVDNEQRGTRVLKAIN